jgi:hypothetical protein
MTRHTLRNGALGLMLSASMLAVPGAAATIDDTRSTPVISGVMPATLAPAAKPQVLRITGQDFLAGLTLEVRNPSGQSVIIPTKDIRARTNTNFEVSLTLATAGNYSLVVTNTDGGVSPPFALVVAEAKKQDGPVINKVTPAEPTKRNAPQPLMVEGERFVSGLRAVVTDPMGMDVTEATVGKVTPNSFEIVVKLEHAGEYSIVVTNPSGAVSNVFRVLVR